MCELHYVKPGLPIRQSRGKLAGAVTFSSRSKVFAGMNDDLIKSYKAIPIPARMDMALSADLDPKWRPCIVRDQHSQVKAYFSRRVDLTPEEVAILLSDLDQTVRLNCAKRDDLTPEQVEQCVSDRDPNLRYFVARNPLLTDAQRERLLADEDPLVRKAAAKGPKQRTTRARPGQAEMIR